MVPKGVTVQSLCSQIIQDASERARSMGLDLVFTDAEYQVGTCFLVSSGCWYLYFISTTLIHTSAKDSFLIFFKILSLCMSHSTVRP